MFYWGCEMRTKKQRASDAAVLLKAAKLVVDYIQDPPFKGLKFSCNAIEWVSPGPAYGLRSAYAGTMGESRWGISPRDFEGDNKPFLHNRPLKDIERIQNHRALALLFFREMILSGDAE
jgi:hypothetical protein